MDKRIPAVLAAALSLAFLSRLSIARAAGASSKQPAIAGSSSPQAVPVNSSAAQPLGDANVPGQALEIPAAPPPSASNPSDASDISGDSPWSDGTQTYVWKDESDDGSDGSMSAPDSSLPEPSYASVDEYMNQGMEAEALGPAFSPFFSPFYGGSMPLMMTPFGFAPFYPSPAGPPPIGLPHRHRHRLSFFHADPAAENPSEGPPHVGMSFGHAARMH